MRSPVHALVVAAGAGLRTGGEVPKQFREVAGRPLLVHAVAALRRSPLVDGISVVIAHDQEPLLASAFAGDAPPHVIGGASRADSVRRGLSSLRHLPADTIVLIHDAARAFLPARVVEDLVTAMLSYDGALPVMPVVDTLAVTEARVLGPVVPRAGLVRVQTPQVFRLGAISAAHEAWRGEEPTDDAQVARAFGLTVGTVEGDPMLEKLTYPNDFARAEARLAEAMQVRTGLGFDVHAFCPGDAIMLGGISVPHSQGLAGHSDADVVLHALVDAMLGTIGAGDIGQHFPPTDAHWKGAPSARFVDHAMALLDARGAIIDHADVTVICEAPKVGPHREAIRCRVAALLRLPPEDVSIKATTTECMGFTGRREGIAAQAIVSVRVPRP